MYNFLGKDNITFHTILWPAILLAVGGLQLPYDVPANEFMNIGGKKIAKSRTERDEEVPVYLPDLLAKAEPDAIRFYGAYHMPQNHDSEFDFAELLHERDQILADQWGNLVQRVMSYVHSHYDGRIPTPRSGWDPQTSTTGRTITEAWQKETKELEAVHLKEAIDIGLDLVREANRMFHEAKPWATKGAERDTSLYEALWSIKALAVLLDPFIPFSCEKVARMFKAPELIEVKGWARALEPPQPGAQLDKVEMLFPKAERAAKPVPAAEEAPLDIRVGLVRDAGPHPNAEKLIVMQVDLGEEKARTIVAGLKPQYTPDQLKGRSVAILANLAPRPLRGILSQGMILAAASDTDVVVIEAPPGTPPGTPLEGVTAPGRTISYDEFSRVQLVIAKGTSGGPELVVARIGADGNPCPVLLSTGQALSPSRPIALGARVR
jgi:methionyl-tRNA synthetase